MSQQKRQALLIGVMLVMLACAAGWSANRMLGQRQRAQFAANDLAACKALAEQIESLRNEPTVASAEAMGVQELGERIEAASRRAQLGSSALEGVFPQAARRVGDSPYMRKPTAITLQRVTLPALTTFLHHLTADAGLTVRDLRFRAPAGESAGDQWNAEVTLTYLIYDPAERG